MHVCILFMYIYVCACMLFIYKFYIVINYIICIYTNNSVRTYKELSRFTDSAGRSVTNRGEICKSRVTIYFSEDKFLSLM